MKRQVRFAVLDRIALAFLVLGVVLATASIGAVDWRTLAAGCIVVAGFIEASVRGGLF